MHNCLSVIHYEYKMQIKNPAAWGLLLAAAAIALLDNFPNKGNLARLEFLPDPVYFVYRTMSLDGLIMSFGLLFLLSNRIPLDLKTGVKSLMTASPLSKGQYLSGKLFGGFLYTFTMLALFLTLNTFVYFAAAPFSVSIADCLVPLIKTIFISALPISIFIGFTAVALPALMDIRLFYLSASVLFIVNASSVNSAESMPFYLITSGDLIKLIWRHPKWPSVSIYSIFMNLLFLLGVGLLSWAALFFWKKLWREDT